MRLVRRGKYPILSKLMRIYSLQSVLDAGLVNLIIISPHTLSRMLDLARPIRRTRTLQDPRAGWTTLEEVAVKGRPLDHRPEAAHTIGIDEGLPISGRDTKAKRAGDVTGVQDGVLGGGIDLRPGTENDTTAIDDGVPYCAGINCVVTRSSLGQMLTYLLAIQAPSRR